MSAVTGLHGPCFRTIDGRPGRLPDSDCYRFGERKRFQGVATIGFEAGGFFPGRTTLPTEGEVGNVWLSLERNLLPGAVRSRCEKKCVVALVFIGRRTAIEGSYGHMGLAKHLISVDQILDAKTLDQMSAFHPLQTLPRSGKLAKPCVFPSQTPATIQG